MHPYQQEADACLNKNCIGDEMKGLIINILYVTKFHVALSNLFDPLGYEYSFRHRSFKALTLL
jgi:hypothetical protein